MKKEKTNLEKKRKFDSKEKRKDTYTRRGLSSWSSPLTILSHKWVAIEMGEPIIAPLRNQEKKRCQTVCVCVCMSLWSVEIGKETKRY